MASIATRNVTEFPVTAFPVEKWALVSPDPKISAAKSRAMMKPWAVKSLLARIERSEWSVASDSSLDGAHAWIVPTTNAREAAVGGGIEVHPMRNNTEVVDFLNGDTPPRPLRVMPDETTNGQPHRGDDFRDVRGQFHRSARSKSRWRAATTC
jgi:hypothetical protein